MKELHRTSSFFTFAILFVTQICILKAWSCDPGWYKNKDGCYSISIELLSWNRAYDECSLKGGTILGASHLKSFESTFPFQNVSRIHFNVEYSIFFGRFYESDKEVTFEESITWKPGYPQDLKNKACTSFDEEGFIVNIDCSMDLLTSVCFKELSLKEDSTGLIEQELCPKDFVRHEHNCYFFSEERKNNRDAIKSCEPMAPEGATLLIIRNQNQNNFINGYTMGKQIWIGLRHLDGNGTYGWPDGSLLKKEDFINWGEGEPSSPSNDKEACAENLDMQWNDCSCGHTIPFACQAEEYHKPTANCDFEDGLSWVEEKSSGMCYTVISREQSWSNAAESCVNLGDSANLVSIGTPQQDKFIRGRLRTQNRKGTYWIGMKKLEDKIFWSDLSPVSYFNWKTLPENGCSKTSLDDDHWIFDDCETAKYPSICQRKGKNYIEKPEPVKNDCPDAWKRFGIHCFYFSKEKKNYKDSLDFCKTSVEGGNLAIIRSSRLNDFLYGNIESDSYIGLNDIETEGDFVWEDGSSLDGNAFTFWGIGEPNDNDHKENCIEYKFQHRWNDGDCELERAFICQVEYSICPASSTVLNQHCLYTDSEPKTCNEAEKICQNTLHHGHLASIHDWGVNDFLRYSIKKYHHNFWIGLKKSAGVSDFATWLDGTNIDFNNYLPGEEIDEVEVCELIASDGFWYSEPSYGKHGFACSHKPKYYMGCRSGWVKSDSSCYLLVLEKLSFQKAEGKCRDRGGYLAIIDDKAEIDFIEAMYPYENCGDFNSCNENFWIGLSSRKKRAYFEWIDGSEMRIHNWDGLFISRPIEKTMCVWAHHNRLWKTVSCDSAAYYLCESPQMISEVVPPSSSGCKESQMAFMHYCYTLFHRLSKFTEAQDFCSNQYSKLLTITTREIQNRMVSYIVGIKGNIHIDLQYSPYEKKWYWGDGTILEFANWKVDEPNINIEDEEGICAVIITEGRHLGEWKAIGCNEKMDFICEEPRTGYTESPPITITTTTLSPEFKCPENFDLISNRCFYFSHKHWEELKDFYEADADCKKYGARLAYFESLEEQNEVIGSFQSKIYIGLRYIPFLDRFLWMEPGITFGPFQDWYPGELDLSDSKYCVHFEYYWTLTKCSNKLNYLCSMKPSKEPFTTKTPPTKAPETPCHPDSKDGWFVIAEYDTSSCYKISELNSTKTWVEARQACLNEKGDLASLHSHEINDYLWAKMENLKSYVKVWIGLNNLYPDKVHRWSDGSVINFSNWAEGEPNDHLGMEGCAEMYMEQLGVWNDMHCRNENPYICRKPRYGTYPTQNPTPPPQGHCEKGVPEFEGHCYRISEDNSQSWEESIQECREKHQSQLLSVHSEREMAFLVSKIFPLIDVHSIWSGGSDTINEDKFEWADQSEFNYANWGKDEPNGGTYYWDTSCIQMENNDDFNLGHWSTVSCFGYMGFICKSLVNPSVTEFTYKLPVCDKNPEFVSYNDDCYLYVSEPKNWFEAKQYCDSKKSTLVSIHSIRQNSFLLAESLSDVWMGLSNTDKKHPDLLIWDDDSFYDYHRFQEGTILSLNPPNCVYMNVSSSAWSLSSCDVQRHFMCQIQDSVQPKGGCPEVTGWMKGPVEHCFNIPETDYYNIKFDHANMECENLQGVLAGIHSPSDNQWLLKNIPINKRNEEHWFGAYKAGVETESSFHWMDLEPSLGGYVNWDSSSRNNMKGYGVFNGTSGKWRLISDYTEIRSFLCSARKVVPTSPPKPSTTTTITTLDPSDDNSNTSTKLQAGGIAGIVIGIILGMVLVIGVIYVALRPNFSNVPLLFRRSSPKLQKNNAFDNMTYSSSSGSVATSISENMTNE